MKTINLSAAMGAVLAFVGSCAFGQCPGDRPRETYNNMTGTDGRTYYTPAGPALCAPIPQINKNVRGNTAGGEAQSDADTMRIARQLLQADRQEPAETTAHARQREIIKSVQEEIVNRGVGTVTKDYRVLRAQRQAQKEAEAAAAEQQASADMAKQVQQWKLMEKAISLKQQAADLEEQNKKLAAQLANLLKQDQDRRAQKEQELRLEREKAAPVEMPNRPGWINIPVTETRTEAPVVAFASYQPVQQVAQQAETPETAPAAAPAPVAPALSRAEQRIRDSSPDGAARLAAMQAISAKGQARYAQQQEEATKRGEVELQQRPAMAEANAKAQALALEQQRLTLQAQQAQQAANVQMETQQQLQQAILQMQQRQVVPQYPQVVSAGWLNIRFTTYCKGCNRMIYNQLCWRRVRFCPHCGVELDKPI